MSLQGTIIGVDLDGVCSDFYGRMREIAAEGRGGYLRGRQPRQHRKTPR